VIGWLATIASPNEPSIVGRPNSGAAARTGDVTDHAAVSPTTTAATARSTI
jgi:hypothetical protein